METLMNTATTRFFNEGGSPKNHGLCGKWEGILS
jgi:hypothetical protein